MKDMEREKFEGSWKHAFDDAEVTPSDKVWANIELDLEKARGGDLKKRLLFFQMLAAASVVFAMTIGGIGYYYTYHADRSTDNSVALTENTGNNTSSTPNNSTDNLHTSPAGTEGISSADEQSTSPSEFPGKSIVEKSSAAEAVSEKSENAASAEPLIASHEEKHRTEINGGPDNRALTVGNSGYVDVTARNDAGTSVLNAQADAGRYAALPLAIDDRTLAPFYTPGPVRLRFPQKSEQVDPVVAMMAKLAQREREVQEEENKEEDTHGENLWTSVGFAAGSFNTVNSSASPSTAYTSSMAALTAPIVDQEAKANGYTYSMGVNVGTRISERWVVQGGVNYLTQASEYIANNIVRDAPGSYAQQKFRAASTNELMMADASDLSQKLLYSAPYSVNNNMRYLSIPVQAGYLLVNKTFGLQLNAGVATDLFLQNTISAESHQIAKTSQPAGSDSPYRAVNLSGLFGTEVSYRFGDHYRVSLNPGIRYPFNTIYKSELGVQSSPLTFDVGLRFRYIFK